MENKQLDTTVALFIFNRPKETSTVFECIRKVKPKSLFIIADGPRDKSESQLCDETREILKNIDWPCIVRKNYSDVNLGCKNRLSSGIDWVFANNEKAIILEDDCVPSNSFFYFCEELLIKYKDSTEIMHIGGLNMQDEKNKVDNSYYFSRIAQIWGWATWKRAWKKYDVKMSDWPLIKNEGIINKVLKDKYNIDYFNYLFERMYRGELSTWDVAWTYTCMKEGAYAIVPNRNMIKNIGFGVNSTHSNGIKGNFGNFKLEEIDFPLVHPQSIFQNEIADELIYKKVFGINTRISQKLFLLFKFNLPFLYNIFKKIHKIYKSISNFKYKYLFMV